MIINFKFTHTKKNAIEELLQRVLVSPTMLLFRKNYPDYEYAKIVRATTETKSFATQNYIDFVFVGIVVHETNTAELKVSYTGTGEINEDVVKEGLEQLEKAYRIKIVTLFDGTVFTLENDIDVPESLLLSRRMNKWAIIPETLSDNDLTTLAIKDHVDEVLEKYSFYKNESCIVETYGLFESKKAEFPNVKLKTVLKRELNKEMCDLLLVINNYKMFTVNTEKAYYGRQSTLPFTKDPYLALLKVINEIKRLKLVYFQDSQFLENSIRLMDFIYAYIKAENLQQLLKARFEIFLEKSQPEEL